jgi:hypothetical protein
MLSARNDSKLTCSNRVISRYENSIFTNIKKKYSDQFWRAEV